MHYTGIIFFGFKKFLNLIIIKVIYLLTVSSDNNLTGILKELNATSYAESRFSFYNNIIR